MSRIFNEPENTQRKSLNCYLCTDDAFETFEALIDHLFTLHPNAILNCDYCDQSFGRFQVEELFYHQEQSHRVLDVVKKSIPKIKKPVS